MPDKEKIKEILEKLQNEDAKNTEGDYDDARTNRSVSRDLGEAINLLARSANSMIIMEIGTRKGYFTVWLALAARAHGGRVYSFALDKTDLDLAKANIENAGLSNYVEFMEVDPLQSYETIPDNIDFVFLNSEPSKFAEYYQVVSNRIRPGGTIVAEKIMSHPEEVDSYVKEVRSEEKTRSIMFPLGRGLEVTYKLDVEEAEFASDLENEMRILNRMKKEDLKQREDDLPKEKRWRSVSEKIGKAIDVLSRVSNALTIVEVGTSHGYSTAWLALSIKARGGMVTTFETEKWRQEQAKKNIEEANLSDYVEFVLGSPEENTDKIPEKIDFVFLDSEKEYYLTHLETLFDKIRPGGTIVADNAISHFADLREYINSVRMGDDTSSVLFPLEKGLEITYKFEDEEKVDSDIYHDLIR